MRRILLGMTAVALASVGAWLAAERAVDFIEAQSAESARASLSVGGREWADVTADGLQVYLRGEAPDEVARFRAITRVGKRVGASRLVDETTLMDDVAVEPPRFVVEMLSGEDGVTLFGLIPATMDRDLIARRLTKLSGGAPVRDILEVADYPAPANWRPAFDFGLQVAEIVPNSKVSIRAGEVSVVAAIDNAEDRPQIQDMLMRAAPSSVRLTTDLRTPRPILRPFTLRFTRDADGAHFDACAADGPVALGQIRAAAERAGLDEETACVIALGAPSAAWGDAAEVAIDLVGEFGAGTATLSGTELGLDLPMELDAAKLAQLRATAEARLPSPFALTSITTPVVDVSPAPFMFQAYRGPRGATMRGPVRSGSMYRVIEALGMAELGVEQPELTGRPDLPEDWTLRQIAAIETLGKLDRGRVEVTPDMIRIEGVSGDPDIRTRAAAKLADRLGPGAKYALAVRYNPRLDPNSKLPDGRQCEAQLNSALNEADVTFERSSARIDGDRARIVSLIRDALTDCEDFEFEISGHTDSGGADAYNLNLSQSRATALLTMLRSAGVPAANMTARGYGEAEPIATNDTEEGRETNRRLTFKLLNETPRPRPFQDVPLIRGLTTAMQPPTGATADPSAPGEPGEPDAQPTPNPAPTE